jgi:hypothetical protein
MRSLLGLSRQVLLMLVVYLYSDSYSDGPARLLTLTLLFCCVAADGHGV